MNQMLSIDIDLQTAARVRGHELLEDFDRIRDTDPVYWSEKSHCWMITRHADVTDAFMRRMPLSNEDRMWAVFHSIPKDEWESRLPNLYKYSQLWITSTEGPSHARLRPLIMKALNRKIVENLRPYATARAEFLIDQALAKGEIEFNEEVARAMTGDVLFKLLGMPEHLVNSLRDWANGLMEAVGVALPTPTALERADWSLDQMNLATMAEVEKRRIEPKDDLITGLLQASEGEDRLSIDEIKAQMHTMIVAGHDTTMNTMTLSMEALARNPEAWAYAKANPDKVLDIVTELQRYVTMSGGQARLVTEDFELHGKQIKKGEMVMVMIAAANRDPDVFTNADQIDFTRDNRKSMVFAPGIHFCLGHNLAKMQLTEFMSALIRKVSHFEVLDRELDFIPVFVFRGLYQLNMRLTAN